MVPRDEPLDQRQSQPTRNARWSIHRRPRFAVESNRSVGGAPAGRRCHSPIARIKSRDFHTNNNGVSGARMRPA